MQKIDNRSLGTPPTQNMTSSAAGRKVAYTQWLLGRVSSRTAFMSNSGHIGRQDIYIAARAANFGNGYEVRWSRAAFGCGRTLPVTLFADKVGCE